MFTRVCFRDQVLISTILATLITLLKAVAMAQPMSTQQLQRFMRDPDNADEPLKYVWDFLNENPMQPDPWPVGLYTWVEFRRETLRDVKELYKFTGNPWPDVNTDDLLISLGYEKRKVYRTFYVFKDGVRLASHWRLFDHERRLEEYADMEPVMKVMKKPASKKTMKQSMKKKMRVAMKAVLTGIPTKVTVTNIKKVLAQYMKVSSSQNVMNGMKWSTLLDIIRGHFNIGKKTAVKKIREVGYQPRRFEHMKTTNGVVNSSNKWMIQK